MTTMTEMPDLHTPDAPPPVLLDMLATGATYRQIDYWVRNGYLTPDNRAPGSGANRRWSARDWWVAYLMVRLVRSGITVEVANDMALRVVDHDDWTYETPDGVRIEWKVSA